MSTSYLVTGCNRGLGLEFVKQLSERNDVVIFASVRNPSNVPELEAVAKNTGNIRIVKINSESVEEVEQVASMISKEVGKLDVLIANAGIAKYFGPSTETPLQEFKDHWNVNVLTVIILFQAMWRLLQKSSKPKFIPISSQAGSIGMIRGMSEVPPCCAYGASKAALNFFCVKAQAELRKDNLVAFPLSPGFVRTDMGFAATKAFGMEPPMQTVDSVKVMLNTIDNCTMDDCGTMREYNGNTLPF